MRTPAPLPPELVEQPFHVQAAYRAGVSPGRLRASDLAQPFRGVRVPRALLDLGNDDRNFPILCDAYAVRMPRSWFFSHETAARLLGLPLPRRLEKLEVHVTAPQAEGQPRGRFVRGHTVDFSKRPVAGIPPSAERSAVVTIDRRRIHAPAPTWCELATKLSVDELVQVGDALLSDRRGNPWCSRHELESAVAEYGNRRGARRLRSALPQLRERVWSPRETRVRLILLRAGFPEPACNLEIRDSRGRLVAIGDLVYPRLKVLIEYEGEAWHDKDSHSILDIDRFNRLSALGWTIVRVRKHHSAADIDRMVREALVNNGWRG